LDFEATYHIYNNKSRFIDFRLSTDDDVLYTSKSIIPIKGFGTISIIVTTIEEPTQYTLYLYNMVLISSFHISIASLQLFIAKSVY